MKATFHFSESVLKSWFECNYFESIAHHPDELPEALTGGNEAACELQFNEAMAEDNYNLAAAVVVSAFTCILSDGRNLGRYVNWFKRANQLIQLDGKLFPISIAAMEVHRIVAMFFYGISLDALQAHFSVAAEKVERGDSDALRIMLSAIIAAILFMSGKLHAAEELEKDALHISPAETDSVVAKLFLATTVAFTDTYRRLDRTSEERFSKILTQTYRHPFPFMCLLMVRCFRLMSLAQLGLVDQLEAEAERVRSLVIPKHKYFQQSFMRYSLGVAAFLLNKPSEALTHANSAIELAKFCMSKLAKNMAEFLRAQSMSELQPDGEKINLWLKNIEDWKLDSYLLLVAAAYVEVAKLHLQLGNVLKARQEFEQAVGHLPKGEILPDLNRPRGFATLLKKRLLPDDTNLQIDNAFPIQISTFGELKLRIGNAVVYDRDWHGNRAKTLLKAIIVLGGKKVSSQRICDLLWPDVDRVQAGQNLKVALWRLKHVGVKKDKAPIPWLVVQHGMISLASAVCEVDALRLIEIIESGDELYLDEAMRLYKGDFLANDDSESWIISHREKLRARYSAFLKRCRNVSMSAAHGEHDMWLFNS